MKKRYVVATVTGIILTVLGLKKMNKCKKLKRLDEKVLPYGELFTNANLVAYGEKLVKDGKLDVVHFTDINVLNKEKVDLTGVVHGWGILGEDVFQVAVTFVNGEVLGELIQKVGIY